MGKAADNKWHTNIDGVVHDDPVLILDRKLNSADQLAIEKEEVCLVLVTKLPGNVMPVVVGDHHRLGTGDSGRDIRQQNAAGIVVGILSAG